MWNADLSSNVANCGRQLFAADYDRSLAQPDVNLQSDSASLEPTFTPSSSFFDEL